MWLKFSLMLILFIPLLLILFKPFYKWMLILSLSLSPLNFSWSFIISSNNLVVVVVASFFSLFLVEFICYSPFHSSLMIDDDYFPTNNIYQFIVLLFQFNGQLCYCCVTVEQSHDFQLLGWETSINTLTPCVFISMCWCVCWNECVNVCEWVCVALNFFAACFYYKWLLPSQPKPLNQFLT